MATNDFKPFAIGSGANVTSQADYEALAALITGFQSGKASSAQINKSIRQSSVMAYVLAQFISDSTANDVLDNGTPDTILANLKSGLTALTPGRLLNMQLFTASGTYTPTPGTKSIVVEVQGAGGGGGGIGGAGTNTVAVGNGGAGGGYAKSRLTSGFSGGIFITVGTGGPGGNLAPTNGSDGGLSSFGSAIVANGGAGGLGQNQTTPPYSVTGSLGGIATGGNIVNMRGGASSNGAALSLGNVLPGIGGAAMLGLPVLSPANNGAAVYTAFGYGAGGGGSYAFNRAGFSGGNGANGVVIIWEYA